jgi:hypothetical protein
MKRQTKIGVVIFLVVISAIVGLFFCFSRPQLLFEATEINQKMQRAIDHGKSRIQKIDLYGKVVDQYGNPVPDVQVVYDAGGLYLAPSTGLGKIRTDEKGLFNIDDAKGVDLGIMQMSKPGYQFKAGYDDQASLGNAQRLPTEIWNQTKKTEPYVFTLWKVDRFPNVKQGEKNLYVLPDGSITTLDFLEWNKLTVKKGLAEGDLTVSFTRTDESWHVKINALGGGLQERKSLYTYLAPEDGYVENWEYNGMREGETSTPTKELFFKSRNGDVYGFIVLNFHPYFRENSAIRMNYVINLEKTRDLTVKEEVLNY